MNSFFKILAVVLLMSSSASFAQSAQSAAGAAANKSADPFTDAAPQAQAPKKADTPLKARKKKSVKTVARTAIAPVLQFENTLVQYTPFSAFMNKFYAGDMDLLTLSQYGDFGFGAFNNLDSLMVANEGKFYKIAPDGQMEEISADSYSKHKLPFALVSIFRGDTSMMIPLGEGKKFIEERLIKNLPSRNHPVAVKISGKFAKVLTRSIGENKNLDETLDKVFQNSQVRREFVDVFGTVIGFYIPQAMRSILPEGWHFYFVNEYSDGGGQLIDFESGKLTARAQVLTRNYLILPHTPAFNTIDMNRFSKTSPNVSVDE